MRAGSIGGVAFLIAYAAFATIDLTSPGGSMPADAAFRWVPVIARVLLPLGFLLALVQAELVAGRVLRKTVELLVHRPPLDEVEAALARALGDPGLRLAFRRDSPGRWIGVDGEEVSAPPAGGRQKLTHIIPGGIPPAAIIHDGTLDDEPELLRATGAAALLAHESAILDTELQAATRELRESRARLVAAGDDERRRLERDIHEGALQQLVALRIKLAITSELGGVDPELRRRLDGLRVDVDQALDDLRELACDLYPPTLVDEGLLPALQAAALRSPLEVRVVGDGVGRFPLDVEAAVYFCCLEALHNASKHAGRGARVLIRLTARERTLHFVIKDDGVGFDSAAPRDGSGFAIMRDRVGALDGAIEVDAGPGKGTTVEGWVPGRSSASADRETRPARLSEATPRPVRGTSGSRSRAG
jgi:signal transduction histidine kinase